MRTSQSLLVIGMAVAPMALIIQGLALADQPPAPPPPTTPAYICDSVMAADPAYFGVANCQPFGGMQATGLIAAGTTYTLTPRTGDPLGNVQSYQCSGGAADTPSTVAPKKCTAIGSPVPASVAPSPVPFTQAGAAPPPPPPAPAPPK